jgi:hypothetical protein
MIFIYKIEKHVKVVLLRINLASLYSARGGYEKSGVKSFGLDGLKG